MNHVVPDLHPDPAVTVDGIAAVLSRLDEPVHVVRSARGIGVSSREPADRSAVVAVVGPLPPESLGSADFRRRHGLRAGYMAGAMANGIASADLVVALARAGYLASFGAAGLLPERIEEALQRFQAEIPGRSLAVNLIHSPSEERLERRAVDLYCGYRIRCVEASAFMDLTSHIVRYRLAGLRAGPHGVVADNQVIAKVSRPEVAAKFLAPAPRAIVAELLAAGLVTAEQAHLSQALPMADAITVEADSGGHTDRRPLGVLFPTIQRQRDATPLLPGQRAPVDLGAAGGLGTPEAVAAAFALGADYVVTGSINQSCVESGTAPATRRLLAAAGVADCEMAPAADMFEMGVQLQVLRRGTLFPMRARSLYELYRTYASLEEIPDADRARLEKQVFRRPIGDIWADVQEYFSRRDPFQLERASHEPKRRMALVF
ncbi:MAG TPA: PfaD family polyunsaturated fatty acid/polyketide biosynthesis protein, partial [Micromonosporaceae bacterium]